MAEFTRHTSAGTNELSLITADLGKQFEAFDLDAADAQMLRMMEWAASETEWLDAHPSDPCYAEAHATYSSIVTLYGQTAKLYREAIAEDDPNKLSQGDEAAASADAELQLVGSVLSSTGACTN